MLRAGLRKQDSGTMDSHLLVVSGVSNCWRSGCSETEMNPNEAVATERASSRPYSDGSYDEKNRRNRRHIKSLIRLHRYATADRFACASESLSLRVQHQTSYP